MEEYLVCGVELDGASGDFQVKGTGFSAGEEEKRAGSIL